MRPKTLLLHAGVALAVVIAYEHVKKNGVPTVGTRP